MRFIIILLCLQSAAAAAAPRVVVSIAPLQELTAAIMQGVATPDVIIGNEASAHHFAFKPSHMQLLQKANLVIWIGRRFEAGFSRVPEVLPESTRQVELLPALGIKDGDGHIWYSPELLMASTEIIVSALMKLDPENDAKYRSNADELVKAISRWRLDTQAQWQNQHPRFITDHAFSAHFETDMGLGAIASIHDQHDSHGGFRDLKRIEDLLASNPAACLLTLESPISPIAQNLAQKYQLKIVNVLRLQTSSQQATSILQRLEQLNLALLGCL